MIKLTDNARDVLSQLQSDWTDYGVLIDRVAAHLGRSRMSVITTITYLKGAGQVELRQAGTAQTTTRLELRRVTHRAGLTRRAQGLLALVPLEWEWLDDWLAQASLQTGRSEISLRSGLRVLEERGYVGLAVRRDADGRPAAVVRYRPSCEETAAGGRT